MVSHSYQWMGQQKEDEKMTSVIIVILWQKLKWHFEVVPFFGKFQPFYDIHFSGKGRGEVTLNFHVCNKWKSVYTSDEKKKPLLSICNYLVDCYLKTVHRCWWLVFIRGQSQGYVHSQSQVDLLALLNFFLGLILRSTRPDTIGLRSEAFLLLKFGEEGYKNT